MDMAYITCFYSQGALLQHLKEHIIHGSMHQNDVYFYYSTVGLGTLTLDWMDDVELVDQWFGQ